MARKSRIFFLIAIGALAAWLFRGCFIKPDTKTFKRYTNSAEERIVDEYKFREPGFNLKGRISYFLYGLEGQTYQGFVEQKDYLFYKAQNLKLESMLKKDVNTHLQRVANKVSPENKYIQYMKDNLVYKLADKNDKLDVAQKILDIIHRLPYIEDVDEYDKHPVETLIEGGDCEDLSILYASLSEACGIKTVLLIMPGANANHATAAVNVPGESGTYVEINDKRYYLVETTGTKYPSQPVKSNVGQVSKTYKKNKTILAYLEL